MARKLTVADINKLDAKWNQKTKISILEQKYEVHIHTFFRDSLIENIIRGYINILNELHERTELEDELLAGTIGVLYTLILREFSDLPIPKSNQAEPLIRFTKKLVDSGIMKEVLQAFPQEQMELLNSKLELARKNIGQLLGELTLSTQLAAETDTAGKSTV